MKKLKRIIFIINILILIFTLACINNSYGENKIEISEVEYSKEYKEWLNLSDEEKEKTLEPLKYEIKNSNTVNNTRNILKLNQKLKAEMTEKYDLREVIPENMVVRNQKNTSACWTFAILGSLESNLAIKNLKNSKVVKKYDFSEMHMNYSTSRESFLDGKINEKGTERKANVGGSVLNALMYLSNGSGAIKEEDMPFEDTNDNIDISRIQNKEIVTTLNDMRLISSNDEDNKQIINKVKEYIKEYGGIQAGIHGASISGTCYNNETGAIYCDDKEKYPKDHSILIIGWDDNYSINNFNEECRPKNNGAWIIKNSWGEKIVFQLDEIKKAIFENNKEKLIEMGYTSEKDITDEQAEKIANEMKLQKESDGTYSKRIGDDGFMYVSYEDVNINNAFCGIQDSEDIKSYKNIYQNDELGASALIAMKTNAKRIYLANVFERDKSIKEQINKVSIFTYEQYDNCKVYINPNGESREKTKIQEVQLKKGENISIEPGYSTLEFVEPIEITSDKFAVILEFDNDSTNGKRISIENNSVEEYKNAVIEENVSFAGSFDGEETDIGKIEDKSLKGNINLKAFSQDVKQNEEPPEEPEKPEKPEEILSDYTNASAKMIDGEININSKDIENSYVKATILIDNIKKGNEQAKYKYSYYISDKKGEKNIKDEYWVDTDSNLVKEEDGTYSLTLKINSKDLKNYLNITDGDVLYIYIKETAQKGENIKTQISEFEVKYNISPDINIDGKKEPIENINNNKTNEDPTIANKKLPFTGMPLIISIFVIIVTGGIIAYFRYKNIDK